MILHIPLQSLAQVNRTKKKQQTNQDLTVAAHALLYVNDITTDVFWCLQ